MPRSTGWFTMNRLAFTMNGLRLAVNCQRFTVIGPQFTVIGLLFTVIGPQFTVIGLAITVNGPRFTMNRSAFAAILAPFMKNPARRSVAPGRLKTGGRAFGPFFLKAGETPALPGGAGGTSGALSRLLLLTGLSANRQPGRGQTAIDR